MDLNRTLSIGAVLHIGKLRYKHARDGKHLIWTGPDNQTHDLGTLKDENIYHEFPGFHKSRTHALGNKDIQEALIVDVAPSKKHMTVVIMKDGTSGVGPNYKMALRNAALKAHLKKQFHQASGWRFWESLWYWPWIRA